MFQCYVNEDGVVIKSKSAEATINGWCQEFTKEEVIELRKQLETKKKQSFWYKLKKLFKGGK